MKGILRAIIILVVIGLIAGDKGHLIGFLDSLAPGKNDIGTVVHHTTTTGGVDETDCKRVKGVVKIYLDPAKYPYSVHHAKVAFAEGQPRVWHLDRKDAEEHREEDLQGMETNSEKDIDEMPPAATVESAGGKANVEYIPASDNRGAGASMGNQLRGYCEGQAWKLVLHANPAG